MNFLDPSLAIPGQILINFHLTATALIALDTRLNCFNHELDSESEPHKMIHAADEIFELYFSLDVGFPLWKYFSTPSWKRFVKALDFFTQ
jgi:hypothetical protein